AANSLLLALGGEHQQCAKSKQKAILACRRLQGRMLSSWVSTFPSKIARACSDSRSDAKIIPRERNIGCPVIRHSKPWSHFRLQGCCTQRDNIPFKAS